MKIVLRCPWVSRKQMESTELDGSSWCKANELDEWQELISWITVAFSWEARALVVVVTQEPGRGRQDGKENWQWCCWSREINDVKKWEPLSADRSVMILSVLWLWVFLQQTVPFFWDGFTAQRELLNHPVHPALVGKNGFYSDYATLNWFKSTKIREGKRSFKLQTRNPQYFGLKI